MKLQLCDFLLKIVAKKTNDRLLTLVAILFVTRGGMNGMIGELTFARSVHWVTQVWVTSLPQN